jgi:hypothetical protein
MKHQLCKVWKLGMARIDEKWNRNTTFVSYRKRGCRVTSTAIRSVVAGLVIAFWFVSFHINYERSSLAVFDSGQDPNNWSPVNPWDPPPEHFFKDNETGSMRNCSSLSKPSKPHRPHHKDSGTIIVSCHEIVYRVPKKVFQSTGDVIIGVLSAASGTGPNRRRYIRETWAYKVPGVFFIVAGPWENIENEYNLYQDMIWIDEDEIYQGEASVLTYKTVSFFAIAHILSPRPEDGGFVHAIKTDDDSYVNIGGIYALLQSDAAQAMHYWGHCPQYQVAPLRDPQLKWAVSFKIYPEPMFPLYCQGAGFGLSRLLLQCAVDGNHVSKFRYNPFEDVAIGILAERCGKSPTMVAGVKVFRADSQEERDRVKLNRKAADHHWKPPANMKGKLIQHRVETEEDMINHHKSLDLVPHPLYNA